jgi:hypothetical protein
MARLARDINFRPPRLVSVELWIIVALQVGGVALRAHVVPVLIHPSPVERVGVRDPLIGIKVKPALPSCFFGTRIPSNGECLQATVGELDQILLEGFDAKRVCDLIVVRSCPSGPSVVTKKRPSLIKKRTRSAYSKVVLWKSPRTVVGFASCIAGA